MIKEFIALKLVVLTVSDTRTIEKDTSGAYLARQIEESGHSLLERKICQDNIYQIRAQVSQWVATEQVQGILITGGTGLFVSDVTPEAVCPLFDKTIEGFGELFRWKSYEEIGSSTIQSRALAGIANRTLIFVMPGSTGACRTAWPIIESQIDATQGCSFVNVLTMPTKTATTGGLS